MNNSENYNSPSSSYADLGKYKTFSVDQKAVQYQVVPDSSSVKIVGHTGKGYLTSSDFTCPASVYVQRKC